MGGFLNNFNVLCWIPHLNMQIFQYKKMHLYSIAEILKSYAKNMKLYWKMQNNAENYKAMQKSAPRLAHICMCRFSIAEICIRSAF